MMSKVFTRYTKRGLATALCAGASIGVLCSAAMAQQQSRAGRADAPLQLRTDYFGYAASVSTRVGYSDNINLVSSDLEEDEIILSTAFSGGVITSTNRFTGIALADVDFSYLTDQSDLVVNQSVGGTGTATIADNWLYFDISGQTSRQLIGDNARFSSNLNAGRNQRANVHSFALSPYLYHRLPNQSSVTARYRYSQTFIDDSGSVFGSGFLNDSTSHEVNASYNSGNLLDRVRFGLTAYGNQTDQDPTDIAPAFGYDQGSLFANAEVAVARNFSLSGAAGYDEIDTDDAAAAFFDDDELSGFFWRAGFTARPSRRGFIRLEYGQRYDDDFIDADASYQISERLSFNAGASRRFQTRTQSISGQFRNVQLNTLAFADRLRQGEAESPRNVISAANEFASMLSGSRSQTIGVGVVDQAYASLNGVYGRTNLTFTGSYADSDFGFRQIETFNLGANVSRDISRKLRGYAGGFYRRADTEVDGDICIANPFVFGINPLDVLTDPMFSIEAECADIVANNGVTNTFTGRVGASYQLYKNVAVFSEFAHTTRTSPVDSLEFSENSVFAGITLDF